MTIKPSFFNTDPKAPVLVKDVFREDVLELANQYVEDSPVRQVAQAYLQLTNQKPEDLLSGLSDRLRELPNLNQQLTELRGRLDGAYTNVTSLANLAVEQKDAVVTAFNELVDASNVKVVFDNVEQAVRDGVDALHLGPLLKSVNEVLGNVQDKVVGFVDLAGQSALVRGLAVGLLQWGLIEVIDQLINSVDDPQTRDELWQEQALAAARAGDLDMALHTVTKLGSSRALAIESQLTPVLFSTYRRRGDEQRGLEEIGEHLLTYAAVVNQDWDRIRFQATLRPNLTHYLSLSDDARMALLHTTRARYAAATEHVVQEEPSASIKRVFPQLLNW